MISVCMATYNGMPYIVDQLESITAQLAVHDEVIISDDGSTDGTLEFVRTYAITDARVKVFQNDSQGVISNFNNAMSKSKGDLIFLSDQDDIWEPNKVKSFLKGFDSADLIVSDCYVVDFKLDILADSFYKVNGSKPGFSKNLIKNSFLGCCMAFRRNVYDCFGCVPEAAPMHDWYIGLVAQKKFKVSFIKDKCLKFRRHSSNTSSTFAKSEKTLKAKIVDRLTMLLLLSRI